MSWWLIMKRNQALGSLMFDVQGLTLNEADKRRLRDPSVGGVILFSRNYENRAQLKALTASIRSLREPALLIAVDQEGGRVQRFQEGFTRLPSMAVFGRLLDEGENSKSEVLRLVQDTAHLMAEELISCGVDFSFAPVLDLGLHQQTVVGDRAFHAEPEKLVQIARAFIQGMNDAGMQATGKHFPGHGHVLADSHLETPVDQRSFAEIESQDMRPFKVLNNNLGAVMTAHIDFCNVDSALPTFSSFWLQNILRQQISFEGVIFSDDLSMRGACIGDDITERVEKALMAGCDMTLICNDQDAMDTVLQAGPFLTSASSHERLMKMKAVPGKTLVAEKSARIQQQLSAHT